MRNCRNWRKPYEGDDPCNGRRSRAGAQGWRSDQTFHLHSAKDQEAWRVQVASHHDQPLQVALTRAFYWQQLLADGVVASGSDIAKREGLHHSTVNELLRLCLLEPAIIETILAGQQPRCMSLLWFQRNPLPTDWVAQREVVAAFDA